MQINIILIDDNLEYCNGLKNDFWAMGQEKEPEVKVHVTAFQNLQDGFSVLQNDTRYKAVILDAMCLLTGDQQTEDFRFLPEALDKLEKLDRESGRPNLPFVINTAYSDREIVNALTPKIERQMGRIFDKSLQEEAMFTYLLEAIEKSEETKIEKRYADLFEIFDLSYTKNGSQFGYFPDNSARADLLKIFRDSEKPSENANVLTAMRRFQEKLYRALAQKYPSTAPEEFKFTKMNRILSGNRKEWKQNGSSNSRYTTTVYQTEAIGYLASAIYKISSDFGAHEQNSPPTHVPVEYWEAPSNYAVKSLVYGLLEQLLWFRYLMDKDIQ